MKEKVCVLMATYNPTEYLVEQVESIFNQKDVEIDLIIRDDASQSRKWILKMKELFPQVTVIEARHNLGVIGNVWKLIEYAAENRAEYNFFAYSDQDDVWMLDKLITGVHILNRMDNGKPNLYYSNLLLTDKNLNPEKELFPRGVVNNTIEQGLANIFEFACTSIFNRKMLMELNNISKDFMQFDHLIYYMALIRGTAFFDDVPHIYYRQHGNNLSGDKKHNLKYYLSKITVLSEKTEDTASFKRIASYIMRYFDKDLNKSQRDVVKKVAEYNSLSSRLSIVWDKRIRAGYQPRDFFRTLRLLVGKY